MSDLVASRPDRVASGSSTETRRAAGALAGLIVAGLALRLIIAYLLPGSGFEVDRNAFLFWAANLAQDGPWGFYDRPFFHDYTPGFLYVLWALGMVGQAIGGLGDLVKLPAIVSDLVLAWLAFAMVRDLGGGDRRALVAAAIVLFVPVTWFDSVVWGQVDSFGLIFVLLAIRATWRERWELAAVFGTMAAITKPQLGIVVPIVAAVVLSRTLLDRRHDAPDPPPDRGGSGPLARLRDWTRRERGPVRILTTAGTGLATAFLLCLPFGLSLPGLIEQIVETAGGYPYLTVNAYNPWALVTDANGGGLAATGQWLCDAVVPDRCAEAVTFGPFWAVFVGSTLLLAVIALVMAVVARSPDRLTVLVALCVLSIAFFVVPTRVHERYLYPFFIVGAILAAVSWRWAVAYAVLAVANFLNMYVVLTTLYPGNPSIEDWLGIGPAIRSPAGITAIAVAHLAGFVWAVAQLRPGARATLARDVAGVPPPDPAGVDDVVVADDRDDIAAADAPGPPVALDPDVAAWARGRLGFLRGPGIRPDRSASLDGEPGGRLGRLDIWLLVVLLVATGTFRLHRLDEPLTMHFDEVYHARTATEFLQSWRYGIDHDIYEYTHPHLAKYAMAAGIVLFGDGSGTAESAIGVPVRDAAIEPRWEDPARPDAVNGDRVYVATGSETRAFDLRTRQLAATIVAPGATSVGVSRSDHRLYVGTDAGAVLVLDTATALDPFREVAPGMSGEATPDPFATVGAPVARILATGDGASVVVATTDDQLVVLDAFTGGERGRRTIVGIAQLAEGGSGDALVARPGEIADPDVAAAVLAGITAGSVDTYVALLGSGAAEVVVPGALEAADRAELGAAIADGRLTGLAVEPRARVAVAGQDGVTFVSTTDASIVETISLEAPVRGIATITGLGDDLLYATAGSSYWVLRMDGPDAADPRVDREHPLPGAGGWVAYDSAAQLVEVLGERPEGGPTVYTIEPHGNSVFQDVPLAFQPTAWALDEAPRYPGEDRQEVLTFAADGTTAAVDIGNVAVAWRLPGVLAGLLAAAALYLLGRILFRRRAVAVALAAFVLVDPMFFVQSRIAMNDVYAGLFIVAAVALFAAIWTGAWRGRGSFAFGLPLVGVLLGLALASKWVAAYAIGAIVVLVLVRSALGRLLLILGLIGLTAVLGFAAIDVEAGATGGPNFTFLAIMVALTIAAAVVAVLRPVAWTDDETRFAVGAPLAAGVGLFLVGLAVPGASSVVAPGPAAVPLVPALAFGLVALAVVALVAFNVAGRVGFGPLAAPPAPTDPARLLPPAAPAPEGWLRLGSGLGVPAAWIAVSLAAVPLAVYILLYIPWALLDGHQLVPGWPEGHTGQTLWDLTRSMYDYHDNLRATHPAASPWWAWPLDLKPVWFYQGSFAGDTAAAIYDHGSLVSWWLAVPAMAFVAWQAWARRSLALALVLILFLSLWIPWARIDRATFQYHWYTSLPFTLLALGYFVAELWHGPSRRTWLLARVAAAIAVMGPVILWLGKAPLCVLAGVEQVNPGSPACVGDPGQLVVTARIAGVVAVVLVTTAALVWQLLHLDRPTADGRPAGGSRLAMLAGTVAGGAAALLVAGLLLPDTAIVDVPNLRAEVVALFLAIPLGAVAWVVLTARDARRFAAGAVLAAAIWTVVLYPNIAALPVPSVLVNAYQGILPTYLYPFQFAVNTDPAVDGGGLLTAGAAILGAALALTVGVVAYSAWTWRLSLAERAVAGSPGDAPGDRPGDDPAPAGGTA